MKSRDLNFIIGIAMALLIGATASAKSRESDLKSDLELDIDNDVEESPQHETPRLSHPSEAASSAGSTAVGGSRPGAGDVSGALELAQSQYEKKQYEAAINTLRPLNDVLPRSGLLLLAKVYGANKDSLNEIKSYELCIAKSPKDYVVQNLYGEALIRAKRVEDGILAFQEARKLNPRYLPAYDSLLRELEKKGENYEARNVVNDMIKTFGPKGKFFTALCRLYAADSFNEKAVELCEVAIEKDPSVAENHVYLGLSLKDREETEKANQVLTHAARRFPASEPVQSAMGELYMAKKDFVSAYNYYRKAATADPKSGRAWTGYGVTAFELQKNEEALKAFVQACKLDRNAVKQLRLAMGKLRVRKDIMWQTRYEIAINNCQ